MPARPLLCAYRDRPTRDPSLDGREGPVYRQGPGPHETPALTEGGTSPPSDTSGFGHSTAE